MPTTSSPASNPPANAPQPASASAPDPYAPPELEARLYYDDFPSKPRLVYRSGKEEWSPPHETKYDRKYKGMFPTPEGHPLEGFWWNHSGDEKIDQILLTYGIEFTTIELIRFKWVGYEPPPGEQEGVKMPSTTPATIWIGVAPGSTSSTAAHDAAEDILALLKEHDITDVDVEFRESLHIL